MLVQLLVEAKGRWGDAPLRAPRPRAPLPRAPARAHQSNLPHLRVGLQQPVDECQQRVGVAVIAHVACPQPTADRGGIPPGPRALEGAGVQHAHKEAQRHRARRDGEGGDLVRLEARADLGLQRCVDGPESRKPAIAGLKRGGPQGPEVAVAQAAGAGPAARA